LIEELLSLAQKEKKNGTGFAGEIKNSNKGRGLGGPRVFSGKKASVQKERGDLEVEVNPAKL